MSELETISTTERIGRMFLNKELPPGLQENVKIALHRMAILEANHQNYALIDQL